MNHVISCHGEAPFPAPSWFCVLDLAWTLSPCMNFSKVQKKSHAENSHHCQSNFFQRKIFKDNTIKIVFSYFIVISPWSHDLLFRLDIWDCHMDVNQHYFLPKARRVLDCKTVRIFAYSSTRKAVKQKVWNEAEDRERDWGETRA